MQALPPIRPLLAAASRTRPSLLRLRSITNANASNRRLFNSTTASARFHLNPSRPSPSTTTFSHHHSPPHSMNFLRSFFSSPSSDPAQLDMSAQKAQKLIDENAVMVFSKSYCPFCRQTKQLLSSLDADFKVYEMDNESDGADLQNALEGISGQRTVPNVYIKQKHIGGNSDVQSLSSSGKLKELLKEAGAIQA